MNSENEDLKLCIALQNAEIIQGQAILITR